MDDTQTRAQERAARRKAGAAEVAEQVDEHSPSQLSLIDYIAQCERLDRERERRAA